MLTADTDRAKFHKTGHGGLDNDWMLRQPDGNYYCQLEWDFAPSAGLCCIFRKGDAPDDYKSVVMRDQNIEARMKPDPDPKADYEIDSYSRDEQQRLRDDVADLHRLSVYCCATEEQIEFHKNVVRAYGEAERRHWRNGEDTDSACWNCNHVVGHAAAQLGTIFYDEGALDTWHGMDFRDEEEPVFYSCQGDNLTKHIFDLKERDYITCSPNELAYNTGTDYTRFATIDDLFRLATDDEKEWLQRCRHSGAMVE